MNTNQKNIGVSFWLVWVLASTVGFGLGAVLGIVIPAAARVPGVTFPIFFGAVFGATGALAQWIVIRRQQPECGLWVPFSTLVCMLAVSAAAGMDQRIAAHLNPFFVIAGIYGMLGGFLQGLILEKCGVPIAWWMLASLLGGLLGGAMNDSAVAAAGTNAAWQVETMEFFLTWFRLGAPFGLGLGLTTGAALVWFLRDPKSGTINDASRQVHGRETP